MADKKKITLFIVIPIVILLASILFYCFAPFFYGGSFNANDYNDLIENYKGSRKKLKLDESNKLDSITDIFNVYSSVNALAKEELFKENDSSVNHVYTIRFDSKSNTWYVHGWHRFFLFDSLLYEGDTVIINENGEILAAYIGA